MKDKHCCGVLQSEWNPKLQERKERGLRDLPAVHRQKPEYASHQNVAQLAEHSTNASKQENIQLL